MAAPAPPPQECHQLSYVSHDATLCYGCRTCELVCSLHHTGAFQPERSSIKATRQPRSGTVRWRVDDTCDRCLTEARALCVKYCAYGALRTSGERERAEDE